MVHSESGKCENLADFALRRNLRRIYGAKFKFELRTVEVELSKDRGGRGDRTDNQLRMQLTRPRG